MANFPVGLLYPAVGRLPGQRGGVHRDLLAQLWLHQIRSFISALLHSSTYPAHDTWKLEETA